MTPLPDNPRGAEVTGSKGRRRRTVDVELQIPHIAMRKACAGVNNNMLVSGRPDGDLKHAGNILGYDWKRCSRELFVTHRQPCDRHAQCEREHLYLHGYIWFNATCLTPGCA